MAETLKEGIPRYQQVAADIAAKIVDRQYQVGEKIYSRTTIASRYSVSAETARRAIAILSDNGIVLTTKGSGVVITSYENALFFLKRHKDTETLANMQRGALRLSSHLAEVGAELKEQVQRLVDRVGQFQSTNPFVPYEIHVEPGFTCIQQTLSDLRFWQRTSATVIAIRRGEELMLSPGPYVRLEPEDTIYFVGGEDSWRFVNQLLTEPPDGGAGERAVDFPQP